MGCDFNAEFSGPSEAVRKQRAGVAETIAGAPRRGEFQVEKAENAGRFLILIGFRSLGFGELKKVIKR